MNSETIEVGESDEADTSEVFARFGTFYLDVAESEEKKDQVRHEMLRALNADSRVIRAEGAPSDDYWTRLLTAYPFVARGHTQELVTGSDHFHPIAMAEPMLLDISVPLKNQPMVMGKSDSNAERYQVAWDGVTLAVVWKPMRPGESFPTAGGLVVVDVLESAAAAAGFVLRPQACSPGCKALFAHADLRVRITSGDSWFDSFQPSGVHEFTTELGEAMKGESLAEEVFDRLRGAGTYFAEFKNTSRRIIDLNRSMRELLDEVVDASLPQSWMYGTTATGWRKCWSIISGKPLRLNRATRRAEKEATDKLWAVMARIEYLKEQWNQQARNLKSQLEREDLEMLYYVDSEDELAEVPRISTEFARGTIEHRASRRDSRTVGWATLGGGVAGGVVALVAGGLQALIR